jgi:YVTN family beta-propeller protein
LLPISQPAGAESTIGSAIPVGSKPVGVDVNPVTNRVYVGSTVSKTITVLDGETNAVIGSPIQHGTEPGFIAVNPVTNRVYVSNFVGNSVTVLDGATNAPVGQPIQVGVNPNGIAVNPVTNRVYVANEANDTVSVIDGATSTVVGQPISVGAGLSSTATVSLTVNPVACGPRPGVRLQTAVANGALQVTVVASDASGPTQNRLRELRFGTPANGRVILDGRTHTEPFTYTVPAATDRVTFTVQRLSAGPATTVPLTVTDLCGSWPTLVGGGATAGF